MDDQRNLGLRRWKERLRMATIYVICLVVYYYILKIRSRSRKIDRSLTLERERAREKIMQKIINDEGRKIIRMGPKAFLDLCVVLQREGGLQPTQRVSVEEQVAKTLYILTHNVRNREIQFWFRRSGETTSRHFHRVLRSIIEIEEKYLKQPDGSHIPIEILGNTRFHLFFKDCVGAIDCTHVRVKVSLVEAPKYRGRKDFPTQNVLVACSFDLSFTYVLPGWEGTASYSRILKDALRRTNCLKIPRGKYYVLDAGFMLRKGLITPFRLTHYHLKEFSSRNPPRTPQELFNHRHSSLRNVENGQDIRNKRPLTGDSESYGTNEGTRESLQETGNDQDVTSPMVQIVEKEPRAKKSRKSKEETEFEGLKAALMNIANAFREGTAAYEKAHQKLPITEPEIWKLLEDLQIDRHLFNRAYLYLLDNPERVRALLGWPKNMQKDLLMEMVFGPAGSSRGREY